MTTSESYRTTSRSKEPPWHEVQKAIGDRELSEIPDDETLCYQGTPHELFKLVVQRELRMDDNKRSDAELVWLRQVAKELRTPLVAPRWRLCLLGLKNSSESQIRAKSSELRAQHGTVPHKEYMQKLRKHQEWEASNARFLNTVEARLGIVRRFTLEGSLEELSRLYTKIEEHKRSQLADFDEASPADLLLWEVLDDDKGIS